MKVRLIIPYLVALSLFTSCISKPFEGIRGEGYVEYDITYLRNELDGISEYLLPKKMILTFSPRFTKNTIEGYAGIINIQNITDLKKDTVTTVLKFFNYKYYYTSSPKETPCCFEIMEDPVIEFLEDSILIAGIVSYKAIVNFPSSNKSHEVFYSKNVKADIINKNTAYHEIPGILMKFEMDMGNLTMIFNATKVETYSIKDNEFQIPSGYEKISREKMVKIISELLE